MSLKIAQVFTAVAVSVLILLLTLPSLYITNSSVFTVLVQSTGLELLVTVRLSVSGTKLSQDYHPLLIFRNPCAITY